jgi:asparagine synthase (glutamine-hydrolysing)
MCGIAGAFAFGAEARPVDRAVVMQLNELQRHRGPDGCGLWSSDDHRIMLGHRRLAIIDTGVSGAQPMWDATRRWVISFNGEIYNYRSLREELEHLGCIFQTNSDTEVLINTIARWGEAGLLKLRGMFTFALWDTLKQELWLARDPYGIKPLYVAESDGTVWFASQARPLATCAPVDTQRDAAGLVGFYVWGHVPEPFSWWAGIRMFPAGHVQRIRRGSAAGAPKEFARIQDYYLSQPAEPLAAGELRVLLQDSVRHHLIADVPVGIFLSAGIDSNVIASLAGECGTTLHTVTLAFDEYSGTADDEAPLAELAAKALRSDHATVRIGSDEFDGLLDDFLKSMDQPTIDGLNTYLVSRAAASQGLKVALSGLGGDELFGGYPSFRQIPKLVAWGARAHVSRRLGPAVERLLRRTIPSAVPPKLAGLLSHSGDIVSAYLLRRALYLGNELDALLDESWLRAGLERLSTIHNVGHSIDKLCSAGASLHAQISALESCWYMRHQLLRDTDWSSMAHGLEVRVPFVDSVVLDRLGPAIASNTPPRKSDLAVCARDLPEPIVTRRKTGFSTPVRKWIGDRTGASDRGLRGWASNVHRLFRTGTRASAPTHVTSVAAA